MRSTIFRGPGRRLAALLLFIAGSVASAEPTDSFTATYQVNYGFLGLGEITFELKPANKPGCYVYSGHGQPNFIASMLIGSLSDKSRFCMTDENKVQPQYFHHHEEGDPEESYTLHFDWEAGTVRYQSRDGNMRIMPLPETATDPLSLQIAARLWLDSTRKPAELPNRDFTLVEENEITTYTLAVEPGGTVVVPAGRYETLIVKRVADGDEHLRFWVAKHAGWIPVRVEHGQNGRVVTMELTSIVRQ